MTALLVVVVSSVRHPSRRPIGSGAEHGAAWCEPWRREDFDRLYEQYPHGDASLVRPGEYPPPGGHRPSSSTFWEVRVPSVPQGYKSA